MESIGSELNAPIFLNRGWGNGEVEYYLSDNVAVTGGQLQITASKQSVGGFSYTSGRINSQGKVFFYPGIADSSGNTYSTVRLEASVQAPNPGWWSRQQGVGFLSAWLEEYR